MMLEAMLSIGGVLVASIIGTSWKTNANINGLRAEVHSVRSDFKAVVERLDRVQPEDTRDRVTRLEVRVDGLERLTSTLAGRETGEHRLTER